ncbi:MAG: hypothetical protein NTX01_01830 [Candidatus Omnitrophica bacterium]|nr:hypothetical protein [Candidatus Omnitrophota bacterium]
MNEALRDIKGPLSLSSYINIFQLLAILVFLAILLFLFKFLFKRKKTLLNAAQKPAHEIAYELLEKLKAKDLIHQGKIKEYYSEVSAIIRHYLENRFLLKAPEMTTEEFLFYVRDYSQLIREHKILLKEFLLICDLVKFAKYVPSSPEIDAIFLSARKIVDETKEELFVK